MEEAPGSSLEVCYDLHFALLGLLCFVGLRLVGLSSDSLHLGGRLVYVPVGLIEWEASLGNGRSTGLIPGGML